MKENAENITNQTLCSVHCYVPNNLVNCSTGLLQAETCLIERQGTNGNAPVLCCIVIGNVTETLFSVKNDKSPIPRTTIDKYLVTKTTAILHNRDRSQETGPKLPSNGSRIAGFYLHLNVKDNMIGIDEMRLENHLIDLQQAITLVYDQDKVKASELLFSNERLSDGTNFLCCTLRQNAKMSSIETPRYPHFPTYLKSWRIVEYSNTSRQILNRITQAWYILLNLGNWNLKVGNCAFIILCDIFLGYFIFQQCRNIGHLALLDSFLLILQKVVDQLQDLVQWLMGVPAGLKLNQPLTKALGKFFLYHLELWRTYMNIVHPIMSFIISMFHVVGLFGITFQISVISDLISIATFHCYCFYVYATRLYGAQVAGLLSTWRMFRGKKFNPFRKRVDSGEFDTDQLFVGMLLFAVLLFLLPTTALYYAVFLTLRLTILAMQGIIAKLCWVLNSLPIYSSVLWLIRSSKVSGDVRMQVMREGSPLTLSVTTIPISFTTTCKLTYPDCILEYETTDFRRIFACIRNGELLYP